MTLLHFFPLPASSTEILFCALTNNHRPFRTVVATTITAGFLTVSIAVRLQPLRGLFRRCRYRIWSSNPLGNPLAYEPYKFQRHHQETFPPQIPVERRDQVRSDHKKHKSSPYPRGPDKSQISGSHPPDVEYTAHGVTDRRCLTLSIIRH